MDRIQTFARIFAAALTLGASVACSPAETTNARAHLEQPSPPAASTPPAASSSAPSPSPSPSASEEPAPPAEKPHVMVGGACTYSEQKGTCIPEGASSFTFKGTVDGAQVVLKGNPIDPASKAADGTKPVPCSIKFITGGTCTPCLFSGGSCGAAAMDAFRKHIEHK